jgi:ABC-2 type transport system ATP-binding protein
LDLTALEQIFGSYVIKMDDQFQQQTETPLEQVQQPLDPGPRAGSQVDAPMAVRTRELTKRYGPTVAVDRVSLSVRQGEVYGFLGPNGAGKTTTLRMLVGLVRPTEGTAEVVGRPPGDPAGLAQLGALVEAPAFYPYLSGWDNLEVLARHANVPSARVATVLKTVELAGRGHDRVATYSLGMKQRLGVAAALLKDPELLILDEPTNGLDPVGMTEMTALFRRLGDEGRSVLLSSHQLGEVQQICDRVGVIFKGRLVAETTVGELQGTAHLVIRATPLATAETYLADLLGREHITVRQDELRLDVDVTKAAWITRELVAAGIDVHEIRRDQQSLEEVFLAMSATFENSGGGQHAA